MYDVAKITKKHTYEYAFKEAIMNYFYNLYRWGRDHPRFKSEINDYVIELNYDESLLNIESFCYYFIDEDKYDKNKQKELSELLYDFYKKMVAKKRIKFSKTKM